MEYVSQTVVRQRANEVVRAKLLSSRSLHPDAAFLTELQAVVEEQRMFRRDREVIKQAAITCSEASELTHPSDQWSGSDEETHKGYYKRIEDLALMSASDNVEGGNDNFDTKKEMYSASDFILTSQERLTSISTTC